MTSIDLARAALARGPLWRSGKGRWATRRREFSPATMKPLFDSGEVVIDGDRALLAAADGRPVNFGEGET